MCSCLDSGGNLPGNRSSGRTGSYKRLGSTSTIYGLNNVMHRARRKENQVEEETSDNEKQVRDKNLLFPFPHQFNDKILIRTFQIVTFINIFVLNSNLFIILLVINYNFCSYVN